MLDQLSAKKILQGNLWNYSTKKENCKFASLKTGGREEGEGIIASAAKIEDHYIDISRLASWYIIRCTRVFLLPSVSYIYLLLMVKLLTIMVVFTPGWADGSFCGPQRISLSDRDWWVATSGFYFTRKGTIQWKMKKIKDGVRPVASWRCLIWSYPPWTFVWRISICISGMYLER